MPLHFFHPQCLELHSKTYLLNFTASLWQCSRSDIGPLPPVLGCFMAPHGPASPPGQAELGRAVPGWATCRKSGQNRMPSSTLTEIINQ